MCDRLIKRKYYEQSFSTTTIPINGTQTFTLNAKVLKKGQVEIKFTITGNFLVTGTDTLPGQLMINLSRDNESIINGGQYLIAQEFFPSPGFVTEFNPRFIFIDEEADEGYHQYQVTLTNTGDFTFNLNTYSFIIMMGEYELCSKEFNVNQKFTPLNSKLIQIVPGSTTDFDVNVIVDETNDIELEFNISFYPQINTTNIIDISYEILRNDTQISNGAVILTEEFTSGIYRFNYISDIILVDRAINPGRYTYTVRLINNSISIPISFPLTIASYCLVAKQNKHGIGLNQITYPSGVGISVQPSGILTLTAKKFLKAKKTIDIEFNALIFANVQVVTSLYFLATYYVLVNGINVTNTQTLLNSTPALLAPTQLTINISLIEGSNIIDGENTIQFVFTNISSGSTAALINLQNYVLEIIE